MFYKPEIRRKIREKRRNLGDAAIALAAKQVAAQLIYLPEVIESQHIAYYLPQEGEVDPQIFIQSLDGQNKHFYLPKIDSEKQNELTFYPYDAGAPLVANRFGIMEPSDQQNSPFPTTQLDIIFTPLVGFDHQGNRLGRGAGFYDRTLACLNDNPSKKRPLLIGLAYEFQKIPSIEAADWDIPMDKIVTEKQIYEAQR